MDTLRERIEHDLGTAIARLRHLNGAVAVEELAGPIGTNSQFADEVDAIHANQGREIGFATRERLVERVNRLSMALDRLNSPARLYAMPEVQTCVRCQDRFERAGRRAARVTTKPQFAVA